MSARIRKQLRIGDFGEHFQLTVNANDDENEDDDDDDDDDG